MPFIALLCYLFHLETSLTESIVHIFANLEVFKRYARTYAAFNEEGSVWKAFRISTTAFCTIRATVPRHPA